MIIFWYLFWKDILKYLLLTYQFDTNSVQLHSKYYRGVNDLAQDWCQYEIATILELQADNSGDLKSGSVCPSGIKLALQL